MHFVRVQIRARFADGLPDATKAALKKILSTRGTIVSVYDPDNPEIQKELLAGGTPKHWSITGRMPLDQLPGICDAVEAVTNNNVNVYF